MNVRARHGASYFITFIDDFTRYSYVYLISHKSEALKCFRRYLNMVENQIDRKVKTLRTDRRREYMSEEFNELRNDKRIIRQLSIPNTPQQNAIANRRNRTLLEMVRSMMAQGNLPISYCGDALLTATYIQSRISSKFVPTTTYKLYIGRSLNFSFLPISMIPQVSLKNWVHEARSVSL